MCSGSNIQTSDEVDKLQVCGNEHLTISGSKQGEQPPDIKNSHMSQVDKAERSGDISPRLPTYHPERALQPVNSEGLSAAHQRSLDPCTSSSDADGAVTSRHRPQSTDHLQPQEKPCTESTGTFHAYVNLIFSLI